MCLRPLPVTHVPSPLPLTPMPHPYASPLCLQLFLVHVDLKANASMHMSLVEHAKSLPNVHILKTRRLVQWGGNPNPNPNPDPDPATNTITNTIAITNPTRR